MGATAHAIFGGVGDDVGAIGKNLGAVGFFAGGFEELDGGEDAIVERFSADQIRRTRGIRRRRDIRLARVGFVDLKTRAAEARAAMALYSWLGFCSVKTQRSSGLALSVPVR